MKNCSTYIAILVVTGALSGCGVSTFRLSPEEKINAAYPMPELVLKSIAAMLESTTPDKRAEVQTQLDAKMKRRALTCAKGYSPSWYVTLDSIKQSLNAQACFTEADSSLARWVGIRRAGMVLASPVAAPTTAKAPTSIATADPIRWLRVAQQVGIALVDSNENIEIIDLETGKSIHKESKKVNETGFLSPNGRLFSRKDGDKVAIKSSVTGEVYFELSASTNTANDFHWVDTRTAVWNGKGTPTFIDFASGAEVPIDNIRNGISKSVGIPGEMDTYVLMGPSRVAKVALNRGEQTVRVIAEKTVSTFDTMSWGVESVVADDGSEVIQFRGGSPVHVLSMATLEITAIDFAPFSIYRVTPTPDPDRLILLTGAVGSSSGNFLIIYSRRTMNAARVASDADPAQSHAYDRYEYAPSMKRNIIHSGHTITIVDDIPVNESIPLAILKGDMETTIRKRSAEQEYEIAHRADADRVRIKRTQDRIDEETRRYVPEYRRIPNEDEPASRSNRAVIDQFRARALEQRKTQNVPRY